MVGNIAAFIMPISFAVLILTVRKYPNVDMIPLQLVAGIGAIILGYLFSSQIIVSTYDIFLGFIAGFFQVGFGFISPKVSGQLAGDPSKGKLHAPTGGVTGASEHIDSRNNGSITISLFIWMQTETGFFIILSFIFISI